MFKCYILDEIGDACISSFPTNEELRNHVIRVHEGRYRVICEDLVDGEPCNRIFSNQNTLTTHIRMMHTPRTCEKEECEGLEFPDGYNYQRHYAATHQGDFKCRKSAHCHVHFSSKEVLDKHVCQPITSTMRCTFVGLCAATFTTPGNKRSHLKNMHGILTKADQMNYGSGRAKRMRKDAREVESIPCGYVGPCNAPFTSTRFYKKHLTTIHGITTDVGHKVYLSKLTSIPGSVNDAPSTNPLASPEKEEEPIHVEPKPISLNPTYSLVCWHPNTHTSGRIQIRYSQDLRLPLVVYQCLDPDYVKYPNFVRPSQSFLCHPDIPRKQQLGSKDYNGSGYDRGHLARKRLHLRSSANYKATFFYPYGAPQHPLFNGTGGLWFRAEEREMQFIQQFNVTHSYSGPGLAPYKGIKQQKVARMTIASFFFKILLGKRHGNNSYELECYAFPHENKKDDSPLSAYFIPLDQLKQLLNLTDCDLLKDIDWGKVKRINNQTLS